MLKILVVDKWDNPCASRLHKLHIRRREERGEERREEVNYAFQKLTLVNGLIVTGGGETTGLYYEVIDFIFKIVMSKNDDVDHFPLLGICLGFELLTMIVSEDRNILEPFDAANHASTLHFRDGIDLKKTLFQRRGSDEVYIFYGGRA
ncbi:gamma-glutamyl hydrolase [Striga asiatica]|uniref:Gamma-glutamyl hydrolase n=1 Tax=Striga asiatica TaxID=4170 RepID=A0A5A7P9H4_STRAF|nr:gamma-glutamyl hydrolase [Striga asiatica]